MKKLGILIMGYGTPNNEEDIEAYYTHIRGGRVPSAEMVAELTNKYRAIGGLSPLGKITNSQVESLKKVLQEKLPNYELQFYVGLKHTAPFIEDVVSQMGRDGIKEAVSIVLAPHYSIMSVHTYHDRVNEIADKLGMTVHGIDSWYLEPKFIAYWQQAIHETYQNIADENKAVLIFSAHSLPERIKKMGDSYEAQLFETAEIIANAAKIRNYAVGWQSASPTAEPWLGPDVQDLTRTLFKEKGYTDFVYAPVGFISDHLEVLYDNDIECRDVCQEIGTNYHRIVMPNTNPTFIEAMVDVIMKEISKIS